ncbi:hypothetical protein ACFLSX_01880 [Calditrichota bacterium]
MNIVKKKQKNNVAKSNNFFTDKEQFRTIDTYRIVYFFTAIFWFFITEAGRFIYRPFIYVNHINDFGIADSIGNSGGIIVQIFITLAVLNSPGIKVFRVITFLTIGYILYEIVQPYLPRGVFDWIDIYGTVAGGIIASLFFLILHKIIKKNKVIYKF